MSPTTVPPPDPSRSDVTVDNLADFDIAFCTRHDSYNNVLTFGAPYGEYPVVLPAIGIGTGVYEVRYESTASYFLLLNVAPGKVSCFTHRIASVQLHLDRRCSSQSRALKTVTVQNGGCCGRTY